MSRRRSSRALLASTLVLAGCTAVLGIEDVFFDPNAPQGGGAGDGGATAPDGNVAADGGTGVDASCSADLQSDPAHCGRCGHDCAGSTCTRGRCDAITLADLPRPAGVAVDDTGVYVTSYVNGVVVRLEKVAAKPVIELAKVPSAMGVTVSGSVLAFTAEASVASGGGAHVCTLPACASPRRIGAAAYARHLAVVADTVFFASEDGVFRARVDNPGDQATLVTDDGTQPFSVVADAEHVYFSALSNGIRRVPLDGGAVTNVGLRQAQQSLAYLALDTERFYWAFPDEATSKGQVFGALKAAPQTITSYQGEGRGSVSVAVDDTNVYWADYGTDNGATLNGDGTLETCPKTGCPPSGPIVLASGLRGAGQIAVDANAVYFAELGTSASDGRVRKVAKP